MNSKSNIWWNMITITIEQDRQSRQAMTFAIVPWTNLLKFIFWKFYFEKHVLLLADFVFFLWNYRMAFVWSYVKESLWISPVEWADWQATTSQWDTLKRTKQFETEDGTVTNTTSKSLAISLYERCEVGSPCGHYCRFRRRHQRIVNIGVD